MKKDRFLKLKGRIVQIYGSQEEFAKAMGKTDVYVSKKLNKHTKFTLDEIKLWATFLEIKESEIWEYFFCQ